MEKITQKIFDHIRKDSHIDSYSFSKVMEIALYSTFLKYCELDKNEGTIKVQDFFHVFSRHENFNEFQIEKVDAEISVMKFVEANGWLFDNESFRGWFLDIFTVTIFEESYYPAFLYIAKVIDQITEKQELIEIFESFLFQFWRDSRYGGIIGNSNINKMISEVLDIKVWTVYDPACGSGQLLVEIQKQKNQKIDFFWKEINPLLYGLAKINLYVHWISSKIEFGDTLATVASERDSKFDYVVCDPPFWAKDFENLWIEHVINSLDKNGKWIILLPLSSTFKKTGRGLREELVNSWVISSVILLPKWSLKPYTSIDTVLWIFDKQKDNKNIFFIDWRKLSVDEIIDLQDSKYEVESRSKMVTYEDIVKYDYNLNPWVQVNWIEKEIENYSEDKRRIGRWLQKFIDISVPTEYLEWLPESLQLLIKKGKVEGKITYDELLAAMPHAEDDVEKLDDVYTRLMKLNIEIIDSFDKDEIFKQIKEAVAINKEYEETMPKQQKEITDSKNEQKINNLDNITKFNDEIHKKLKSFSEIIEFSNEKLCLMCKICSIFRFTKIDNKKTFELYTEKAKDSLRLLNIMSLNLYIEDLPNDNEVKTKKQLELVKYFDEHLAKEWLLRTRNAYANRLFWFLVIESMVLLGLIIWAVNSKDNKDFLEFIKIFASVWLGQIALMVTAIVAHLFPKNGDSEKDEKNTSWSL